MGRLTDVPRVTVVTLVLPAHSDGRNNGDAVKALVLMVSADGSELRYSHHSQAHRDAKADLFGAPHFQRSGNQPRETGKDKVHNNVVN